MNNIIERYIHDVVRRLPADQREEVSLELNSNIREMLRDNPSEKEIEEVLNSLGHPRKLASDYRGNKRYIIGPEWFDDYITVLKIAAIIFACVAFVSGSITQALNLEATTTFKILFEIIGKAFSEVVNAVFRAFAIVTVIFFIVERANNKERVLKFDIKCLPELPNKKKKNISRLATFISLVANITIGSLMLYFVYRNTLSLSWIPGGSTVTLPIFTESNLLIFIPLFIVVLLFNIALDIYKLDKGQWTSAVILFHCSAKVMQALVAILFIIQADLFHADFVSEIANFFNTTVSTFNEGFHIGATWFAIITGLGAFGEIVSALAKTIKYRIPKDQLKKMT